MESLFSIKKTAKNNIKEQFWIAKSVNYVWIIAIEDQIKRDFLVRWLSDIWIWVVITWTEKDYNLTNVSTVKKINSNTFHGFDFFIYDNDFADINVPKLMTHGVTPIMPEKNTYSGILKEFDPIKFEWNGFFWKKDSPFCMFEKVITYLENIKFPEDKRVLLKNVSETF